jgi:peptidyl-prolyl cis-trans isomerase D
MLQNIREHAQGFLAWVIVILISVPFALWGIHEYLRPSTQVVIAEINDTELLYSEFQDVVQRYRRQLQAMMQQRIDLTTMEPQIRKTALDGMVQQEVLVQTAAHAGLRVGDALLAKWIHETFQQQSGDFNQDKYVATLRMQGLTPERFEMQSRRELLVNQLKQGVVLSALLTDYDTQTQARLEKQQRLVTYLPIPANRFADKITVSDEEIQAYFTQHTDQYMTEEKVSVDYVELSNSVIAATIKLDDESVRQHYESHKSSFSTPVEWHAQHILVGVKPDDSPEKIAEAEQKAKDLLARIQAGEAFEALAKEYSTDASAANGGDLGTFGEGSMVKPFEDALKLLKVGQVSEPVRSQFGFHLIKLIAETPSVIKPFDEVKQELVKTLQVEQADAEFYAQLDQFGNLAFEHPDSLNALADGLSLKINTTELFTRQGGQNQADEITNNPKVIEAAFGDTVLKENLNSEPIDLGEQKVVVIRLKEHQPAQPQPLEAVKESIRSTLKADKTKVAVNALADELLAEFKKGSDIDAVTQQQALNWVPAQWIGRQDTTLRQPGIVREAFKIGRPTDNSALYQGIELGNGDYAIFAVLEVKDGVSEPEIPSTDPKQPSPAEQAKKRQQLAFGETEFNQFSDELKDKAKVVIHQDKLEKDSNN